MEMSIVLVIIGLITGGILTGRDLINAAAERAQISQIGKYQTAVRTFQNKYGYLPGDVPDPYATNFGFQPRGPYAGQGDGNGVIEGNCTNTSTSNNGLQDGCGELPVFWQDLSTAGLIDTAVLTGVNYPNTVTPAAWPNTQETTTPAIKDWLPQGKIGQDTYVYVFSLLGINYFAISSVTKIGWNIDSSNDPGLTVQQAYDIDSKMDDGLPQSGSVSACYQDSLIRSGYDIYASGGLVQGANGGNVWTATGGNGCIPTTAATAYAATNCYDNNGLAGGTQAYSVAQNASAQNCALSFKFQ